MENQNSSYSVQIGKTTFIVCVKQSETAKKPIEKMFKDTGALNCPCGSMLSARSIRHF